MGVPRRGPGARRSGRLRSGGPAARPATAPNCATKEMIGLVQPTRCMSSLWWRSLARDSAGLCSPRQPRHRFSACQESGEFSESKRAGRAERERERERVRENKWQTRGREKRAR